MLGRAKPIQAGRNPKLHPELRIARLPYFYLKSDFLFC